MELKLKYNGMSDTKAIFAMRREGRLEEALPLARSLVGQSPSDPWAAKACGWVLSDMIKRELAAGNCDVAAVFLEEFNQLNVPADDVLLNDVRNHYRVRLDQDALILKSARDASFAGEHDEALRLCRDVISRVPESIEASKGLGWAIARKLNAIAKDEPVDGHAAHELLLEYARLKHMEIPGVLHSYILREASAFAESLPGFIRFVRWWNPANLRPEDFEQYKPDGSDKAFDSLVEKVIKAMYKAARKCQGEDDRKWATEFVCAHYQRFPNQEWFPYYYGKLLIECGRQEEAQRLVIPVVRQKQSEFWAWSVLSETFDPSALAERRACLCRAMLCRVTDEKLRVKAHATLGGVLMACSDFPAAKREFEETIRIRLGLGWKIPPEISSRQQEEWYARTQAAEDNTALYEQYAGEALDLLTADIPWTNAVVTGIKPGSEDSPALVFVGFCFGNSVDQIPSRQNRFPILQKAERGMPIRIKLSAKGDRQTVVAVEPRQGVAWDVVPSRVGVVTHVNMEKRITHVVLGRKEFEMLQHDRMPEASELMAGDYVALQMLFDRKQEKDRVVHYRKTTQAPDADFCRPYKCALRLCNGNTFGFAGDIYVHRRLIEGNGLTDGQTMSGTAVCEWNERKNSFTWSAVTGVGEGEE